MRRGRLRPVLLEFLRQMRERPWPYGETTSPWDDPGIGEAVDSKLTDVKDSPP
jgi:hypothetical protein